MALQLGLWLIAHIQLPVGCVAAFRRWPDVLSNLLAAADWGSPFAPHFKLRALRSLKHIFKGLMTKRFVAEPLPQQPGGSAALGALLTACFYVKFLRIFIFFWFGSSCLQYSFTPELRSLKHIFKGLMTKQFVEEPLPQQPGCSAALGA
jgi:hypothetical protein